MTPAAMNVALLQVIVGRDVTATEVILVLGVSRATAYRVIGEVASLTGETDALISKLASLTGETQSLTHETASLASKTDHLQSSSQIALHEGAQERVERTVSKRKRLSERSDPGSERSDPRSSPGVPSVLARGKRASVISDKQANYIRDLCLKTQNPVPDDLESYSNLQAHLLIQKLLDKPEKKSKWGNYLKNTTPLRDDLMARLLSTTLEEEDAGR